MGAGANSQKQNGKGKEKKSRPKVSESHSLSPFGIFLSHGSLQSLLPPPHVSQRKMSPSCSYFEAVLYIDSHRAHPLAVGCSLSVSRLTGTFLFLLLSLSPSLVRHMLTPMPRTKHRSVPFKFKQPPLSLVIPPSQRQVFSSSFSLTHPPPSSLALPRLHRSVAIYSSTLPISSTYPRPCVAIELPPTRQLGSSPTDPPPRSKLPSLLLLRQVGS
jgi:hypothetical protein